jgi:hypothetical protein
MHGPANATEDGIFASHALQLRAHGLAVLPIAPPVNDGRADDGKKPLIKGFNAWRGPPSVRTVARFAQKYPDANIAVLPGASNLFIADVDSAEQAAEVEELFGRTPLHVQTSRGLHFYYRNARGCDDLPGSLRAIGLDVDLKAGNSVVLAPPSRHRTGAIYRHKGSDWHALKQIPEPNLARLRALLARKQTASVRGERFTEGQRGLGLNRLLCRHAAFVETFDELLDVARTINDDFSPPLSDAEVMTRARQVWKDVQAAKLRAWVGCEAVARCTKAEITRLNGMGRNGADALNLLMLLRMEHEARCRRGETFCIAAEAMQAAQVIPGWNWKRITRARNVLLKVGLVELASARTQTRNGRLPAQYRLVTRTADR